MMDDYQAGYNAYFAGRNFDESETPEWQDGWLDAEYDDEEFIDEY